MLASLLFASLAVPPPHHPVHRAPKDLLSRIQKSNPATLRHDDAPSRPFTTSSNRVTPAQFGGDPTGQKDSWAAINTAIQHCLNQSSLSPNGYFPGDGTVPQFGPIRDMGGCEVDLAGGEYRISKPLFLPEMNANMQFGHGSLVASPTFEPIDGFLFTIGVKDSCNFPQGSCNIDINFPELFLDGAKRASGMQINNVMGVTIGPGGYFLNFTQFGLQINKGHEVMMERVWLGETNFDFNHVLLGAPPNATAIQINGNDHYILNTIIFSAKIGVEVNGAADYVQGVHVWFPYNNGCVFSDTMAFHITRDGDRFNGCYIDGGRAVFDGDRAVSKNIWVNGFECCQRGATHPGTTKSGITLISPSNTVGPGLQIIDNEFGGGGIFLRTAMWPNTTGVDILQTLDTSDPSKVFRSSSAPCGPQFNVSTNDKDCEHMTAAKSAGTASEAACEAACCASVGCTAFQWCADHSCDGSGPGMGAQCYIGKSSNCGTGTRKGWQGKAVGGAPGPSPGPTPSSGTKITGTRIEHNAGQPRGSTATVVYKLKNESSHMFDFCDQLVFPTIATARVFLTAEGTGFPQYQARPPLGCAINVDFSEPVTGTITVEVDSSLPDKSFT